MYTMCFDVDILVFETAHVKAIQKLCVVARVHNNRVGRRVSNFSGECLTSVDSPNSLCSDLAQSTIATKGDSSTLGSSCNQINILHMIVNLNYKYCTGRSAWHRLK